MMLVIVIVIVIVIVVMMMMMVVVVMMMVVVMSPPGAPFRSRMRQSLKDSASRSSSAHGTKSRWLPRAPQGPVELWQSQAWPECMPSTPKLKASSH